MEGNFNLEIMEWIKSFAIAIVVAIFINTFVFRITSVEGISMDPTLKEKDRLLSLKVSLYFDSPSPGDIIVFKSPVEEEKDYVKRVIAVEGDTVQILDGSVYVNGDLLEEDYIYPNTSTPTSKETTWAVPEDELFVLGDNRYKSFDSRDFGTIPISSVKGIANLRLFPLNNSFGNVNKTP